MNPLDFTKAIRGAAAYKIELGKYSPDEYSLFTVYDALPRKLGWAISTGWGTTVVWKTKDREAVKRAIEGGYPATDEVTESLKQP